MHKPEFFTFKYHFDDLRTASVVKPRRKQQGQDNKDRGSRQHADIGIRKNLSVSMTTLMQADTKEDSDTRHTKFR